MSHGQGFCEQRHWEPSRREQALSAYAVEPDPDRLTVDQLAARVGLTVRNVRAYAARGLLPPPLLVGRTGYYGREHEARLLLVREMLAEGWSLALIERTLSHAPHAASTASLALHRALVTPWLPAEPEETTTDELARRAGVDQEPGLVDELVAFGLLERLGAGRLRVLDPALLAAGLQVVELGVPPRALLAAQREVAAHVRAAAAAYVGMFVDHGAAQLVADARADPEQAQARVARLQAAAAQALLASFRTAMADAVQQAVQSALEEPDGPPAHGG